MEFASNRGKAAVALVSLIALSACASEPEDRARVTEGPAGVARAAESLAPHASVKLGWGSKPDELGFRPKGAEIGAEGPIPTGIGPLTCPRARGPSLKFI